MSAESEYPAETRAQIEVQQIETSESAKPVQSNITPGIIQGPIKTPCSRKGVGETARRRRGELRECAGTTAAAGGKLDGKEERDLEKFGARVQ